MQPAVSFLTGKLRLSKLKDKLFQSIIALAFSVLYILYRKEAFYSPHVFLTFRTKKVTLNTNPDIILLDEVLSIGDAEFVKKSKAKP
ncbi:hypothetical protein ACMCNP_00115 [Candidatus Acidulodesulfobacterium sp. H_13]|uniref:hypothetical protein n=1 Tax=Candidatus Acidulodesulfobacterium sp. H_13 TaxID=3395470 RepID=UPI003AF7FDDC